LNYNNLEIKWKQVYNSKRQANIFRSKKKVPLGHFPANICTLWQYQSTGQRQPPFCETYEFTIFQNDVC
jgi:hypothetical protein